jgi:Tse1 toxin immunity protein Tsi1
MMSYVRCGLLLFLGFNIPLASGFDCFLTQLPINPITSARKDIFVGKGKIIEVRFRNENTSQMVEVFPEPPLTVRNQLSGRSCDIDGGVWVRQAVYLDADEKTLLVQEFSGSNDFLVFYDTTTCQKQSEIDVSGARWKISNNQISIGRQCSDEDMQSCRSVTKFVLDNFCKLKRTDTERK